MSVCTFIAADVYLEEINNPHYKYLSINEALNMGIEVDAGLLTAEIDKNLSNLIYWSDTELVFNNGNVFDGDLGDNFALLTMDDTLQYCDKAYGVSIEWNYFTEERAKKIIEYINHVLLKTNCVEIWKVWLSYYDISKIKTTRVNIKDLQPIHIK